MAKSLEEHLYRSALTKDEYMDMNTLKTRLRTIAQNLEMHRSTSSNSIGQNSEGSQPPSSHMGMSQSPVQGNNSVVSSSSGGVAGQQNAGWPVSQPGQMQQQSNFSQRMENDGGMGLQNSMVSQGRSSFVSVNQGQIADQQQQLSAWNQPQQQSGMTMNAPQPMGNMMQQNAFQSMGVPQQLQQQSNQGMGSNVVSLQLGQSVGMAQGQGDQSGSWNIGQLEQQSSGSSGNADFATIDQKKKVILQQQQRLLLLRHASKCTAGQSCLTRFCAQMVVLWRHMKTCRDKNCRTSHCLSSRCVLNHYRICKSNGKTATCEVCGPVMAKIKQLERDDGTSDPLTREQDPSLGVSTSQPSMMMPAAAEGITAIDGHMGPGQVDQSQQQQSQLQQLQNQHVKLQQRLESLQQLQKQQNQLLEQQRRLQEQARSIKDPNSQEAQQLQQQQMLLSQLQSRCQQQQLLLQHELQEQSGATMEQQMMQVQLGATIAAPHVQLGASSAAPHVQQPAVQMSQSALGIPARGGVPEPQVEAPKKRRQKSDGKIAVKGRRGSGQGKGLIQLAAAQGETKPTMKRNSVTSPKDRASKKSKGGVSPIIGPLDNTGAGPGSSVSSMADTSLIVSMSKVDIARHLESLNKRVWLSSRTVSHKCLPVVQELIEDQFGWVFNDPVDPVALGLPDYFDVVKNPMHLELVKKKLENAIYSDMDTVEREVKLVFENAILYNGENSEVGDLALTMLSKFDKLYRAVVQGKCDSEISSIASFDDCKQLTKIP